MVSFERWKDSTGDEYLFAESDTGVWAQYYPQSGIDINDDVKALEDGRDPVAEGWDNMCDDYAFPDIYASCARNPRSELVVKVGELKHAFDPYPNKVFWYEVEVTPRGEHIPVAEYLWRWSVGLVKLSDCFTTFEEKDDLDVYRDDVLDDTRKELAEYQMMHSATVYACVYDEVTDEERRDIIAVLSNY